MGSVGVWGHFRCLGHLQVFVGLQLIVGVQLFGGLQLIVGVQLFGSGWAEHSFLASWVFIRQCKLQNKTVGETVQFQNKGPRIV